MFLSAGDMDSERYVIAVSGGIGSGKSVVCRIVSAMGYPVYDCDGEAKRLMDASAYIKERIANEISRETIVDGDINRKLLAEKVFADKNLLVKLNGIVHGAVREDFIDWCKLQFGTLFVESAVLYESGLDKLVDEVWEIIAPKRVRVFRACKRDGADEHSIMARIERQDETVVAHKHELTREILNDDIEAVMPQILKALL